MTLAEQFAAAFNAKDLHAMTELLSPDATAEVLGSGFPVEVGPEMICATSFPHILGLEAGATPVRARAWREPNGPSYVLLLLGPALDSLVRVLGPGSAIERLEYLVQPHRPADVADLAAKAGVPLAPG